MRKHLHHPITPCSNSKIFIAMNAWAQTETTESVYDRVKAIQQRMYDVHAIKKNDNILPDSVSFAIMMKALIKLYPQGFRNIQ